MGELIDGLRRAAEKAGVQIRANTPVTPEEVAALPYPVVIAAGSVAAALLVEKVDPERAEALARIEHPSLVTATFQFPFHSSRLKGFGCLFPPGEARVLGVLMNNSIFPGRANETLSETWILGGALFETTEKRSIVDLHDHELVKIVLEQRKKTMRSEAQPVDVIITRWPKALPHFTVELERAASRFRPNRRNVYLLGNFTGGIGLSKIVDQAVALPEEIARSGQWK
jgi:oxygen-dependent protoporphyrinogen oxidase